MGADTGLQIDSVHCCAISEEIGERLRQILDCEPAALPPRLQVLMLRLVAQDPVRSCSNVPSLGDMALDEVAEDMTGPTLAA
jgi:hypothetical protein